MKPSDDLKREIYKGGDAQTVQQICNETGLARSTIDKFAFDMCAAGKWKKVSLKTTRGFAKAYIKIK